MNRVIWSALAILAIAGMASATTVTCPGPPNGGIPADIMGFTFTCGVITFSNFNVISSTGISSTTVSLVIGDQIGHSVNLGSNPNLTGANGSQDPVSGSVGGTGLNTGTVDATIVETVCSSAGKSGGLNCVSGATEANSVESSGTPGSNGNGAKVSGNSFSVNKGIDVVQGDAVTSLAKGVPEPATMLLIGTGFIGLGLLRRRLRKF